MGQKNQFPIDTKLASKADVGLGNVDNTSDVNKPVSTAQAAAIAPKADTATVNTALAAKADAASVNTSLALKADAATMNTALALKADVTALAPKADTATVNTALALKADAAATTTALAAKADAASMTTALAAKADATALTPLQALSGKAPFNSQTVSYTAQASDAGKRIGMNAAGANTLSLPDDTQVPIPADTFFYVTAGNGSTCTIAPLAGGTASITVESGLSLAPLINNAVYLVIKSNNAGGWRVSKVGGTSVVNDVVTGGTGSALSAEQGKNLNVAKLAAVNGVPAVVGANVFSVRMDKPFRGGLYSESGGVVVVLDNTYTWATRPDPTTCSGAVITISDWNQDFFSDGTNWIPVGKRLTLLRNNQPIASFSGSTATTNLVTDTIPAGLVLANCEILLDALMSFAGTGGTKSFSSRLGTTTFGGFSGAPAASLGGRAPTVIKVVSTTSQKSIASGTSGNSSSSANVSGVLDFTAAVSVNWSVTLADAGLTDSVILQSRSIEVLFP